MSALAGHTDDKGLPIPAVIPGLDGLRAFSILIVMISHSALSHIVPGVFGVTVFFFVSGFLITSLMLEEHRRSGTIGIRLFYMRRMIRLYPPLVVSVLATVLFYVSIGQSIDWRGVVGALAYLANYLAIFRPDIMHLLGGQLWSLAVEEHFYFIYPLLFLWAVRSRSRFLWTVSLLCVASLLVRIFVDQVFPAISSDYNGKATETRLDSILYGALAAYLWWSTRLRDLFARFWKPALLIAFVLLLGSFLWRNAALRETIRYSVQGLALMPIVLAVTVAGVLPRVTRLLDSAPARFVGRLRYSLYLWHLLAFEIGEHVFAAAGLPRTAGFALGWVLAFGFAYLSYRFVEAPFFALRKKFGSIVWRIDGAIRPARTEEVLRSVHPSADISPHPALLARRDSGSPTPPAIAPR